jgi:hypothetical protein
MREGYSSEDGDASEAFGQLDGADAVNAGANRYSGRSMEVA